MSTGPDSKPQSYTEQHADIYSLVSPAEDLSEKVERSVNRWLLDRVGEIGSTELIGDFGCGDGRLIPLLRGGNRRILGVDISRAMLERVPGPSDESPHSSVAPPRPEGSDEAPMSSMRRPRGSGAFVLPKSVPVSAIAEALTARSEVFVEAALEELLPVLGRSELWVDSAISSFNAVCFSTPVTPLRAIAAALRPGGRLLFTSNAFVPSSVLASGWTSLKCDLYSAEMQRAFPAGSMFRHVLHTKNGPVPLEDHVHHMGMLADAFRAQEWMISEALLFPPEGCEHLEPSDQRFQYAYGQSQAKELVAPGQGFSYVKIVVHAIRV